MSQWSDDLKKAEELTKDHPQQSEQAVQEGEKYAEQETGHRYDKEIGEGVQQLDDRFGGGQQQGQQDPQQGQQQDPQQQDAQQQQ